MFDVLTVLAMENSSFWDVIVMIALIIFEKHKPCSCSLYSFLLTPVTFSLLGPNILGSTLLPNIATLPCEGPSVTHASTKRRKSCSFVYFSL
jgi:hypothetical protein